MKKNYFVIFCLACLTFTACKPTEKGYKAAYDAALGKRQAAMADLDVNIPQGALQQVDGPQLKVIDGVKVYLSNQRLQSVNEGDNIPGHYNVAVGAYKMVTNCKSQSNALREEGFEAFPAKDGEGMFYTIAGSFATLPEAVKFYQKYSAKPDRVYVGLPSAPVIIYNP